MADVLASVGEPFIIGGVSLLTGYALANICRSSSEHEKKVETVEETKALEIPSPESTAHLIASRRSYFPKVCLKP